MLTVPPAISMKTERKMSVNLHPLRHLCLTRFQAAKLLKYGVS